MKIKKYIRNTEDDIIGLFSALGIETEEKRIKARHGTNPVYSCGDDVMAVLNEEKGVEDASVE